MIVKDEEDVIGRCLDCVKDIVDEMIIVDTGSKDNTEKIVSQYTDKVYHFLWEDDFSKARNFSFSKATRDYILWLDADDVIDEENIIKLKTLKKNLDSSIDVVMMKYQIGDQFVFYRERLLKREKGFIWSNAVHETINIDGYIDYQDITIFHKKEKVNDSFRNIKIYKKLLKNGKKLNARETFYYARELYEYQYYEEAIKYFCRFLKNKNAWIENKIEACLNLSQCYYQRNEKDKAYKILIKSFIYDLPRSEILCELGYLCFLNGEYKKAIYWYQLALKNKIDIKKGGFIRKDCYDFIPYVQLCICYYQLNDLKTALYYHEKAGQVNPSHPIYQYNCQYFNQMTKK